MNDIEYMRLAYLEAKKAKEEDEVPVGCVIVYDNKVVASSHNHQHSSKNALNHAEIIAINQAIEEIGTWIIPECTMYVTLEPCLMCTGAIINSRIKRVVYATKRDRFGCMEDSLTYFKDKQNHNVLIDSGIMKDECDELLKDFFKEKR